MNAEIQRRLNRIRTELHEGASDMAYVGRCVRATLGETKTVRVLYDGREEIYVCGQSLAKILFALKYDVSLDYVWCEDV